MICGVLVVLFVVGGHVQVKAQDAPRRLVVVEKRVKPLRGFGLLSPDGERMAWV